jgi:hypothetical protein
MRDMDLHCWRVLHVEDFATRAFPETAGWPARAIIRRLQLFAGIPQRVFPRGMGVVVPPCLKILRRALRQVVPPGLFEGIARQEEGCRGALSILAGTAAGIEPARPRPCVGVGRITAALGDHPDPHAIVKDKPAFVPGSWIAAADEFGHDAHSSAVGTWWQIIQMLGAGPFRPQVAGFENVSGRPHDTPIWKLETAFRCHSCGTPRYRPPVLMIRLTKEQKIAPYVWVHPDDDDRAVMVPERLPNA